MIFRLAEAILESSKEIIEKSEEFKLQNLQVNDLSNIIEWDFCEWPKKGEKLERTLKKNQILSSIEYGFIIGILDFNNIILISPGWNDSEFVRNVINTEISYKKSKKRSEKNYKFEFIDINVTDKNNYLRSNIAKNYILPTWLKFPQTSKDILKLTYYSELTLGLDINIYIDKNGNIYYSDEDIRGFLDIDTIKDIIIEIFSDLYNSLERTNIQIVDNT